MDKQALHAAIRRASLEAHKAVEKLDAATLADLQRIYKAAAADLAALIAARAGSDGNVALQELRSLLDQLNGILLDLAGKRDALLGATLATGAELGVAPFTAAEAGAIAVISVGVGAAIAQEAVKGVRNAVATDGLQLSDRIWRTDRQARDLVMNTVERAVIQGYGASQAALELLTKGEKIPGGLFAKRDQANAGAIGRLVNDALLKDEGSPLTNAMRLMRTELNRAHGEAYMAAGESTPGFAGWRYLLSPAHPKPDICDLLSTQNLHGLGAGVYPTRAKTPWPAHPNTLSFVVIVFEDEVTDADRAGKETALEALKRLTPEQQKGALGAGKKEIFDEGKLTQGMIRTPLRSVKRG